MIPKDREGGPLLGLVVNEHVDRLALYQPFDANFAHLYAEYVDTQKSDQIQTRAFEFVKSAVEDGQTKLVILTGDAGHGKTHLCGQLLTSIEPSVDARERLRTSGDGHESIARVRDSVDLHIVKDLSELDQTVAADALVDALTADGRVTVVCANEGRLREVISTRRDDLAAIHASLETVLTTGQTTVDGVVRVINLNFQSVAANEGKTLTGQALRNWVLDQRKWSKCDRCDAKPRCPVFENRRLLAAQDSLGESRRVGLETLLRTAEQTNHVVTIRELLVFLAHTITGGLRCTDVHSKVLRYPTNDWQADFLFHQAAFGTRLGARELERFEVFRATALLDPGNKAIRQVDDALDATADDAEGRFLPRSAGQLAPAQNKQQQRTFTAAQKHLYGFLRRRSYFTADSPTEAVSFPERLGFRYYELFESVLHLSAQDAVQTRDLLLNGLEAIQGARKSGGQGNFAVVDPAFAAHRATASVVALQVPRGRIRVLSQSDWWREQTGKEPDLASAVDWVDRRVYVVMPDSDGVAHGLALDCRQFELVSRAADGLASRTFFQADVRRLSGQLAVVASTARETDEITVLVGGRTAKLTIDVGDVIQAGE